MPKLGCPCGFVHNLSPIPDEGWITIPDKMYEDVINAEIALSKNSHPDSDETIKNDGLIYNNTGRMYECPECKRIMWEKPDSEVYIIYKLNEDI